MAIGCVVGPQVSSGKSTSHYGEPPKGEQFADETSSDLGMFSQRNQDFAIRFRASETVAREHGSHQTCAAASMLISSRAENPQQVTTICRIGDDVASLGWVARRSRCQHSSNARSIDVDDVRRDSAAGRSRLRCDAV
jgi:hypothetical protein